MPGQVEAFAHFGVTLTNPRWSWSGLTTEGQVVATALLPHNWTVLS